MAFELPLNSHVTVDGSITLISKDLEFLDFDTWVQHNGGAKGKSICRVDVIAKTKTNSEIQWLVEVKDFRYINYLPAKKNTYLLHDTLSRKIIDSLTYMGSNDAPLSLVGLYPSNTKPHFVLHYELPSPEWLKKHKNSFPTNFPINAIQKLKKLPASKPIASFLCTNAEQLKHNDDIPWVAVLNDSRCKQLSSS